jgi:hypothetical protein
MTVVRLTSESLRGISVCGEDRNAIICVCGKDFSIPLSKVPFLSELLFEYIYSTKKKFVVDFTDDDKSNSLFDGINKDSIIESFESVVLLLNGFPSHFSFESHSKSLLFLSTKLFCRDLLRNVSIFEEGKSKFVFEPSLFSFNSCEDSGFCFQIGGLNSFKCSRLSAFVLSRKAAFLYNNENFSELFISIPSEFPESSFISSPQNLKTTNF